MSILTGPAIAALVAQTRARRAEPDNPFVGVPPELDIEPFDPRLAGPNSYDVHLGPHLRVYALQSVIDILTPRTALGSRWPKWPANLEPAAFLSTRGAPVETVAMPFGEAGIVLLPDILYLGCTAERIACHGLVPWIDGRSSTGRLSCSVHETAGRGDDGFEGTFTLEITVTHPLEVFPGDRIAQLTFMPTVGERAPYRGRYQGQSEPTASRFSLPDEQPPAPE